MATTTEWAVFVAVRTPRPLTADHVEKVHALIAADRPDAVVAGRADGVSIQVVIEAFTLTAAQKKATDHLVDALDTAGIDRGPVVRAEVMAFDEFEAEVSRPTIPELLGVAEAAARLGVTKQRASQLAQASTFPAPVLRLASGPVWLASTIDHFARTWSRKPGRPKKAAAEVG